MFLFLSNVEILIGFLKTVSVFKRSSDISTCVYKTSLNGFGDGYASTHVITCNYTHVSVYYVNITKIHTGVWNTLVGDVNTEKR